MLVGIFIILLVSIETGVSQRCFKDSHCTIGGSNKCCRFGLPPSDGKTKDGYCSVCNSDADCKKHGGASKCYITGKWVRKVSVVDSLGCSCQDEQSDNSKSNEAEAESGKKQNVPPKQQKQPSKGSPGGEDPKFEIIDTDGYGKAIKVTNVEWGGKPGVVISRRGVLVIDGVVYGRLDKMVGKKIAKFRTSDQNSLTTGKKIKGKRRTITLKSLGKKIKNGKVEWQSTQIKKKQSTVPTIPYYYLSPSSSLPSATTVLLCLIFAVFMFCCAVFCGLVPGAMMGYFGATMVHQTNDKPTNNI